MLDVKLYFCFQQGKSIFLFCVHVSQECSITIYGPLNQSIVITLKKIKVCIYVCFKQLFRPHLLIGHDR